MEENRRRQEESIESREQLLRELEEVQRMTAREKAEEERQRREREEEIQAQVGIRVYLVYIIGSVTPFSPNRDQHQISPHHISALGNTYTRIKEMINKNELS